MLPKSDLAMSRTVRVSLLSIATWAPSLLNSAAPCDHMSERQVCSASEVCETAVPTGLPAAFSFGEKSRRSCHVSRWSFVYPTAGLFQTSVRHDERNGTTKSGNPYHLPCTLPIASPAGIQPPYLFEARSAMSVT